MHVIYIYYENLYIYKYINLQISFIYIYNSNLEINLMFRVRNLTISNKVYLILLFMIKVKNISNHAKFSKRSSNFRSRFLKYLR